MRYFVRLAVSTHTEEKIDIFNIAAPNADKAKSIAIGRAMERFGSELTGLSVIEVWEG